MIRRLRSIVDEVFLLARKNIGGTVIFNFKRRCLEDSFLTELGATAMHRLLGISRGQLQRLFDTRKRGHDGAIVICIFDHCGRFYPHISMTQCWLPVDFQARNISGGTRHRSAVGASLVTDAPIVVSSEERGEITFIRRGSANSDVDSDFLMNELRVLLFEEITREVNGRFSVERRRGAMTT